jgi:hypothetical protein
MDTLSQFGLKIGERVTLPLHSKDIQFLPLSKKRAISLSRSVSYWDKLQKKIENIFPLGIFPNS